MLYIEMFIFTTADKIYQGPDIYCVHCISTIPISPLFLWRYTDRQQIWLLDV